MTIRALLPGKKGWPSGLDRLDPGLSPSRLYLRGSDIPPLERCIAIVGTRRATVTGLETARRFARAFAEAGYVVVSGLARGIDAAAHRAALNAGGETIAVLGCGLDVSYPPRNAELQKDIAGNGSLLTEYPLGTSPHAFHFPERNRIIAGISRGVVVIEGGFKSGALITARHALDIDAAVWAVPGSPRSAGSAGCNHLIRRGLAWLVTEPDHVFEDIAPEIAWTTPFNLFDRKAQELTDEEIAALSTLDDTPASVDQVSAAAQLPAGRVMLLLATLEVRGLVTRSRSGGFLISDMGARALGSAPDGGVGAAGAPPLPPRVPRSAVQEAFTGIVDRR